MRRRTLIIRIRKYISLAHSNKGIYLLCSNSLYQKHEEQLILLIIIIYYQDAFQPSMFKLGAFMYNI